MSLPINTNNVIYLLVSGDLDSMSLPSSRASTPATPASPGMRYKTIQVPSTIRASSKKNNQ